MRIKLTSVMVNDQERARRFYTDVLGFVLKHDIPMGPARWLTVVSPEGPGDIELLLEPNDNPAAKVFQKALFDQGIPLTAFSVDDVGEEVQRLKARGVSFRGEPKKMGPTTIAVFEDTCGNLIQIYQVEAPGIAL
jgi:catechol 2,3-dioxygenase-like lactoylglutathione lyase family enzyme